MKKHTEQDYRKILDRKTIEWYDPIKVMPYEPEGIPGSLPDNHLVKLFIRVREYGTIVGFLYKGTFMHNYALVFDSEIIEWMYLAE